MIKVGDGGGWGYSSDVLVAWCWLGGWGEGERGRGFNRLCQARAGLDLEFGCADKKAFRKHLSVVLRAGVI